MTTNFIKILSLITVFIICSSLRNIESNKETPMNINPKDDYEVLNILPRSNKRYTQGLFLSEDSKYLYESGGLYQESSLIKMKYPSLKIVKEILINRAFFGEGTAKCGEYIYQLTWQEKKILKFNYKTMKYVEAIPMPSELNVGWGLSSSDKDNELFATNGSDKIFRLDCENNLKIKGMISVTNQGKPRSSLNDLAYAENYIWANVYMSSIIYKIDPNDGKVVKSYDMQALIDYEISNKTLKRNALQGGDVLNGICYDEVNKRFVVTGKKWGHLYQINFK